MAGIIKYILILLLCLVSGLQTQEFVNDYLCGTVDNTSAPKNNIDDHCPTPWMVTICFGPVICSGVIIDSRHILTTAKCFKRDNAYLNITPLADRNIVYVLPGLRKNFNIHNCAKYPEIKYVSDRKAYPGRDRWYKHKRLVILILTSAIEFNRCQKPVCIMYGNKSVQKAQNCKLMRPGVVYDWLGMGIPVMSDRKCSEYITSYNKDVVFCTHLYIKGCKSKRGSAFVCQEDDGRYYLYGMIARTSKKHCKKYFADYIRISHYLPWISRERFFKFDDCGIMSATKKKCPDYPWMVDVCVDGNRCSGVVVDSHHILTSALCAPNGTDGMSGPNSSHTVFVQYGFFENYNIKRCTSHENRISVSQVTVPLENNDYNTAIFTLSSSMEIDSCHKPICMIDNSKSILKSVTCMVINTGDTYNPNRRISLISSSHGTSFYQRSTDYLYDKSIDMCQVDPGAGIICKAFDQRYYLYGLISEAPDLNCAVGESLYTSLYPNLPLINSIMFPNFDWCGNFGSDDCPYPWMVTICTLTNLCSGIIVDSYYIITAANCFSFTTPYMAHVSDVYVIPGFSEIVDSSNCKTHPDVKLVDEVYFSPNREDKYEVKDIAIVQLKSSFKFNRCLRPSCLSYKLVHEAQNCMVMRAGDIYDPQRKPLILASDSSCSKIFHKTYYNFTMFCTLQKDNICPLEGGSAFACQEPDGKYYVYGIVTTGNEKNCEKGEGLYIKISYYLPWISNNRI